MSTMFALADQQSYSPWLEMGAYEALWTKPGSSFKRIAEMFSSIPGAKPSQFVEAGIAEMCASQAASILEKAKARDYGVRVHCSIDYPAKLRAAEYPVEFLYYRGWWDLVESPSVAIVGTRKPTDEGRKRTKQMVRHLVADDYTIVSGLATGIDQEAHRAAIAANGRTIGVIGTPLSQSYPAENRELQDLIAREYLLISQVPVVRATGQGPAQNRIFFPERNITMSALTEATIIIEAGETSGTLTQARAALKQGRKLFILDSCFQNRDLTWPERFEKQGAIRVRTYDDIREHLKNVSGQSGPTHQAATCTP